MRIQKKLIVTETIRQNGEWISVIQATEQTDSDATNLRKLKFILATL